MLSVSDGGMESSLCFSRSLRLMQRTQKNAFLMRIRGQFGCGLGFPCDVCSCGAGEDPNAFKGM